MMSKIILIEQHFVLEGRTKMQVEGQTVGRKKKRLGDMLIDAGVLTQNQLMAALEEQKNKKQKLGETLIELGMISEIEIARALQLQLGYDMIVLSEIRIVDDILNLVTDQILRKHMVIPFEYSTSNANILRLAMADPMDIIAIDDLAIISNRQIEPVVSTPRDIMAAIDKYYGNAEAMAVAERYTKEKESKYQLNVEEDITNEDIENSPIVQLVKSMIEQAVRQRASDIHIEPMESKVRVRYRIDGALREAIVYNNNLLAAIVARIKIIGGMDISEKRKPQDGRITHVVDRQEYDIRVSVLPTVFGEKVVMRITSKIALTKAKKDLGFSNEELKEFDYILSNPHGIILVTGPTGSGKSTTLYTAISELNRDDVNIITVEDPVEANVDGVNQVNVNVKAGLTFATTLRSILRQDPDIIMIGEIRDDETAQIAVKAAITGHLVVSTLHTNSATSSIIRLEDMGIEPFLLADSIVGVIAQRLVRRLCPNCKRPKKADDFEKEILNVEKNKDVDIYEPVGCNVCNDTGYYGRIGVYEIMPITPRIKTIINQKGSADNIKDVALEEGMSTIRMSATKYVLNGITSLTEMKRVSFDK